MNKTKGFSRQPSIVDSKSILCGNMICHQCHKIIDQGYYLLIEYYSNSRGNEDDFARVWHQSCSSNHPLWAAHTILLKTNEDEDRIREEARQKIIAEIKKWNFDSSDLFD